MITPAVVSSAANPASGPRPSKLRAAGPRLASFARRALMAGAAITSIAWSARPASAQWRDYSAPPDTAKPKPVPELDWSIYPARSDSAKSNTGISPDSMANYWKDFMIYPVEPDSEKNNSNSGVSTRPADSATPAGRRSQRSNVLTPGWRGDAPSAVPAVPGPSMPAPEAAEQPPGLDNYIPRERIFSQQKMIRLTPALQKLLDKNNPRRNLLFTDPDQALRMIQNQDPRWVLLIRDYWAPELGEAMPFGGHPWAFIYDAPFLGVAISVAPQAPLPAGQKWGLQGFGGVEVLPLEKTYVKTWGSTRNTPGQATEYVVGAHAGWNIRTPLDDFFVRGELSSIWSQSPPIDSLSIFVNGPLSSARARIVAGSLTPGVLRLDAFSVQATGGEPPQFGIVASIGGRDTRLLLASPDIFGSRPGVPTGALGFGTNFGLSSNHFRPEFYALLGTEGDFSQPGSIPSALRGRLTVSYGFFEGTVQVDYSQHMGDDINQSDGSSLLGRAGVTIRY